MTPDTAFSQSIVNAQGHVALTNNIGSNNTEGDLLVPDLLDIPDVKRRPYIGFADLVHQPDDAVRKEGLFAWMGRSGAINPSISGLVAARATADRFADDSACRPDNAADLRRLTNGKSAIEQAGDWSIATFWINPPGAPGALPYIISATRLVDHPENLTARDREALRGAVAVVGITAHHMDDVPGVVFQAFAISTLLDGAALARFAWWQEGLLAAFLVLLWALTARGLRLSFLPGLFLAVMIAGLWGAACQLFFVRADMLLPAAAPMFFIIAAAFVTYGITSVEESAERRNIENIFGRNVSPPVRDYLMSRDKAELKRGSTDGASILFFDVRGSTAFAEGRTPEEVIVALNELFAAIVPMVEAHGGLINRFLGDGFLALFGVPVPLADHALAAAETAFQIVDHLETAERNARLMGGAKPQPILSGGCGVHSGPFVYGYLGAPNRAEFTVIGDTVNLAARLESLNKSLGSLAVFSETTVEQLPQALRGRLIGPIEREVAGRQAKAEVYTLGSRHS
jgi:class 3 adenylate cyclase